MKTRPGRSASPFPRLITTGPTPAPGCVSRWRMSRAAGRTNFFRKTSRSIGYSARQFRMGKGAELPFACTGGVAMAIQPLDEEAIFQLARKIESPEVRAGYLEQVCGDNPPLRARVQALL